MRWQDKLKRETRRIVVQVTNLRIHAADMLRGAVGGLMAPLSTQVRAGQIVPGRSVAIFVIYPVPALAESALLTLRHLAEEGFAPLVVANAPLSEDEVARLLPHCWQLVIRRNLGYDFGGYHEGVARIRKSGLAPEEVLFINDSIWFPARQGTDLLARMRAVEADHVGVTDGFYAGKKPPKYRRKRHVTSYLFLVRGRLFNAPAFQRFWSRYILCSRKQTVIFRGEIGLSLAIAKAGFQSEVLLSKADAAAYIKGLGPAEQRVLLEHLIVGAPKIVPAWRGFCERHRSRPEEVTDAEIEGMLLEVLDRTSSSDCLILPFLTVLDLPILKKSVLRQDRARARECIADMDAAGVVLDPQVRTELVALANEPEPERET
ncbi:rhamnan synthesis F family protein [Poseidonocella sp. HB161398]|uniref:rhamnan synthesis F family protein n=1 Tax=Poseidonocella sp. HB161398 TaxID=2320855 RepID=UPI0011086713|nr:rhamnan synthesis F family protein [Poseidonocella sp. HB161398]